MQVRDPAYQRSMCEDFHRPLASRPNLCQGRRDRVLNEQLSRLPRVGKRLQGCRAPFEVGVSVRNRQRADCGRVRRVQDAQEVRSFMIARNS